LIRELWWILVVEEVFVDVAGVTIDVVVGF
jgi:hypothetical protein